MNQRLTFCAGLVTGVVLAGGAGLGLNGLSAQAAPSAQATAAGARKNTSKVVLDNARVRVKDAVFYPEDQHPGMHTHELPHVGVVIDGGTLVFRSPDGKTETMNLTPGGAGFREANVTHEPINTGKTPVRVTEVELK
jgi:mannose-6-phosphate isomerase-like protein (cupin superfamily)